ncbi:MAG: phage tail family protein [Clostridia bacterium]|nr:phage tail family protein [Clostridia bacterium]
MKIIYENERGKVVMYGGGNGIFNVIEIRGLSMPENDIDTVYYPDMAGCIVNKSASQERIITISGDARDTMGKNTARAMHILSKSGAMTIISSGVSRKIFARCISFETNKRKGVYIPFVLQLMAENPYFQDVNDTKTIVSKREGVLSSPFVLPCSLSVKKTQTMIVNKGDVNIEPVFILTSPEGAVCPDGIIIENLNTGAKIKLNTDIAPNEQIKVDVKNRRITSSSRGNIIFCLDDETSLSEFFLETGVSDVKISAWDAEGKIYAECIYNNNYLCVCL